MKLLVVTSSYPRHAGDIAGRFVLEWVEALAELGHEARVLTWRDSRARGEPLDVDHRVVRVPYAPPGLDTLFYGAGTPENIREQPLRLLLAAPAGAAMLSRMLWECRDFTPDVIVGHWMVPAGLLARAAERLTGVPALVVGHSGGVHLLDSLPTPVGRMLASSLSAGPVTVPSLPLAQKLSRLAPGAGCEILPMGFAPPAVAESTESSSRRDWLCMGRLVDIKGYELAIEAFARAELDSRTTLHIAGDGPRRAALEALASRLDAPVIFHGFVTGEAREALWERCGYVIFSSKTLDDGRHEGLPVSFLEASARGIVPLCTPIPGIRSYLAQPKNQLLDTRDVDAWASRIAWLAGAERAALAAAGRRRVGELAWPRLARRWEATVVSAAARADLD